MWGYKLKFFSEEEDEKLESLREEWGEVVMNAVKTGLEEMNEFNPSGRYCGIFNKGEKGLLT